MIIIWQHFLKRYNCEDSTFIYFKNKLAATRISWMFFETVHCIIRLLVSFQKKQKFISSALLPFGLFIIYLFIYFLFPQI